MNAQLRYSMSLSAVNGFYIDENTGTIYTNKSLAFDPRQHTIQLIVSAVDKGHPPMTAVAAVHIQVVDVNNNAPKFSSLSYTSHIPEDAPRGFTVMKVSATDHDKSYSNHNIDYRITEGNTGDVFAIAGTTAEIILMKSLDREEKASYALKVVATDRGIPALNSTTDVHIYVEDVNDNQPVFNQTHYQAYVSEMAAIDTNVLQVIAKDKDEGLYSKVVYDITSGNDDQKFNLNPNTGIITIKEQLDYDTVSEYKFIVRATDSDPDRPLSALASVVIKVQDENDNAPHFPLIMYKEAIEENSPIGTPIFMAHAIDADRGFYGKLNYSVTEGE
ncbi:Protocadherin-23, partial [Stegodyphus mimosarum]